jgi:hypothetical protein
MQILELFAGSKSIGKCADGLLFKSYSSDIEQFGGIDYVTNILDFDVTKIPFKPDVIWASPPCTAFSVAAIGKNWTKLDDDYLPKNPRAELGLILVQKTLEIIEHFKPTYFFIENPRGMLRKMPMMAHLKRQGVTYCQYGDTRMKPTDIWTNSDKWIPRPMCSNGSPCHISAPRGSRTGTQGLANAYERSKIPEDLCVEILKSCIN